MSKESTIAGLEHRLEAAKGAVAHAEDVRKLLENPLFRKVILRQFCTEDCARYVQESGDPLLEANNRADALNMAQAAGHLRRYLSIQIQLGNHAEGQIQSIEEALVEVRSEGLDA